MVRRVLQHKGPFEGAEVSEMKREVGRERKGSVRRGDGERRAGLAGRLGMVPALL